MSDANQAPRRFDLGSPRGCNPEAALRHRLRELRAEVDSVFPLAEARAAFERVAGRGKRGKVVLDVGTD